MIEWLGWKEKKGKRRHQKELFITLNTDEQILVDLLKEKDTMHIDELHMKSGLNSSSVAAALLNLEFENVLCPLPGKLYKLV